MKESIFLAVEAEPAFLEELPTFTVTTQCNINLTYLWLRLDTIIKNNPLHKLPKLAIWETSNRGHYLGPGATLAPGKFYSFMEK